MSREEEPGIEILTRQLIDVLNDSKVDENRQNSPPMGKVMSLFDTLIIVLWVGGIFGVPQKPMQVYRRLNASRA
jgi:hypothetical protein